MPQDESKEEQARSTTDSDDKPAEEQQKPNLGDEIEIEDVTREGRGMIIGMPARPRKKQPTDED